MCALVFFTQTHIHNTTVPSWANSDGAIAIVSEVLGIKPMEFLAWFEQWACARFTCEDYFVLIGNILIMPGSCDRAGEPADHEK